MKILEVHTDISVIKDLSKVERLQYLESIINIAKMYESREIQSLGLSFNSNEASNIERRVRTVIDYNESS